MIIRQWRAGFTLLELVVGIAILALITTLLVNVLGTGIAAAVWIAATALVLLVAKRKTRGGWRWRHGERD